MKKVISFFILFCFTLFCFISCKKEKTEEVSVDTNSPNSNTFSSSTAEYIKFDLGGATYNLTPPSTGGWLIGGVGSGGSTWGTGSSAGCVC